MKTQAGEDKIQKLLIDFQKLITMKGTGDGGKLTKQDIQNEIDPEFYAIWSSNEKEFEENLMIFNRRRNILNKNGAEFFIKFYYDLTYKSYFIHGTLTYSEIVDKGYNKMSRYLGEV